MKIILAHPQSLESQYGSMQEYFDLLARTLNELGYDVILATPSTYNQIIKRLCPNRWIFRCLLENKSVEKSLLLKYLIFQLALKINSDSTPIVAISQEYTPILKKNNSIVIVHDLLQANSDYSRSKLVEIFYSHFLPKLLKKCKHVISVSKSTQSQLNELGIPSSLVYNYIKIPKEIIKPKDKKFIAILWIGTLAKHKQLHQILDASENFPSVVFNIVLPSRDKQSLPLFISTIKNIKLHSDLTTQELEDLYNQTDFFVSTSSAEGYGRPAMEARLRGVKLLLSDIDIYRELHGEVATFYQTKNQTDLEEKLSQLIKTNNNKNLFFKKLPACAISDESDLAKEIHRVITTPDFRLAQ